jgi:hypothetical protein
MPRKRREEVPAAPPPEEDDEVVAPPPPKVPATPAPPPRPAEPKRAVGSPALGLLSDPRVPWRATEGGSIALELVLTNRGGPLKGAYVEVAGAGVTSDKLVTARDVAVQGQPKASAEFALKSGVARAELPGLSLEAGYAEVSGKKKSDVPPPPPPSLRLVVQLKGEKAGAALVTVRVGPLDPKETHGSALQGKSFVVERPS